MLRAQAASYEELMIVLFTKEEVTVKRDAFRTGANDYLVKLPDAIELSRASATTRTSI